MLYSTLCKAVIFLMPYCNIRIYKGRMLFSCRWRSMIIATILKAVNLTQICAALTGWLKSVLFLALDCRHRYPFPKASARDVLWGSHMMQRVSEKQFLIHLSCYIFSIRSSQYILLNHPPLVTLWLRVFSAKSHKSSLFIVFLNPSFCDEIIVFSLALSCLIFCWYLSNI